MEHASDYGEEQRSGGSFLQKRTAYADLRLRIASALVLLPIGLGSIYFGGPIWTVILTVIVAAMELEWILLWRARRERRPEPGLLVAGLAYIALVWVSLHSLRAAPSGLLNVLFVMLVVWSGDVGAYAAGRAFGGPRLAPAISPGKTWSGALGGTLCAILAGVAVARTHFAAAALLAFGLAVVAQLGDLLESAVKRRFGAKDSGSIIPGHGGLLDRLDGVLAASPAALAVSWAAGPGPLWG